MPIRILGPAAVVSALIWSACAWCPLEAAGAAPFVQSGKEGAMAISKKDKEQIAQCVLDLEALQPYYHAGEVPGRKPLLILKNEHMKDEPRLDKFGEPVRFVSEPGDAPFFEFSSIKIDKETATVEFRYPVEGIHGSVILRKAGAAWKVESHSLKES